MVAIMPLTQGMGLLQSSFALLSFGIQHILEEEIGASPKGRNSMSHKSYFCCYRDVFLEGKRYGQFPCSSEPEGHHDTCIKGIITLITDRGNRSPERTPE